MIDIDLFSLTVGSIVTSAIYARLGAADFFSARNPSDARIKRSLRAAERRRIRAVILGGAVK